MPYAVVFRRGKPPGSCSPSAYLRYPAPTLWFAGGTAATSGASKGHEELRPGRAGVCRRAGGLRAVDQSATPAQGSAPFQERATAVAKAWQAVGMGRASTAGFAPLQ